MVYSLEAGRLPPPRWERPVAATFRSAYTFDPNEDTVNFGLFEALGLSFGQPVESTSTEAPLPKDRLCKEASTSSTTTGTDSSDGSASESCASDLMPKSTTSAESPGGSDVSDSDRTAKSYRLPCPPPQPTPVQRRRSPVPQKHSRPPLDVGCQKDKRAILLKSASLPSLQDKPRSKLQIKNLPRAKADTCVAKARQACASARGLGHRLGTELSDLDDEMASLSEDLKILKSYIDPREASRK